MWKVQDNNKNDAKTVINYDLYRKSYLRYKSERGLYAPSFVKSVKPVKIWFNGHKMLVIGEVRGLKRNRILLRAVWVWNRDFTSGSIESAKLDGASRKDKASSLVLGDVIGLVNDVVNLYITGGE
nr:MAG TPA: hypothetical protein [Caudoviricetes sp.]